MNGRSSADAADTGSSLQWIMEDISLIEAPLDELIRGLPVEALNWCDAGLKDEVLKILSPVLPGWRPTLMVHSENGGYNMVISLARTAACSCSNPTLTSNSLPPSARRA